MDIQKKKVPKDKAWSVAAKTAAMAALGLTAGLGLGACSKDEPEALAGDVAVRIEEPEPPLSSTDSTKTDSTSVIESSGAKAALDSICVRRNTSSGITPKIPLRSEESVPLTGMVSTISTKRFPPKNPAYDVDQKLSQMKGRKTPLMGKAAAISDDEK
ncbi:MAG: hypothetical protein MJY85_08475 [Fibrobacter sp.]|nr:hypothetical protein [Fibrobacter sp.]